MPETKKQISEYAAALMFTQRMIDCSINAAPKILNNIVVATSGSGHLKVADEEQAVFDLMLASSALDLQAVGNLLPKDQALRIEDFVLTLGNSSRYSDYARREIERYSDEFRKELNSVGHGGDPMNIVPALLLHRWFGHDLERFSIEIGDELAVSPLLIGLVSEVLFSPLSGVGTWKSICTEFELVREAKSTL
jgi:hypothetical protein